MEQEGRQVVLQRKGIVSSSPQLNTVMKRFSGDSVLLSCELDSELSGQQVIVEAWTNIDGRMHGYQLNKQKDTNVFSKKFILKRTGFFKITFRYKTKNGLHWKWLGEKGHEDYAEIHVDPAYIKKSIVYNAFIRFFGHKKIGKSGKIIYGDSGTFDDLKKRLDEIQKLGVDILYLNPIHMIGELYRNYNPHDQFPNYLQPGCPYSIKDYKSIDPELGIDKDGVNSSHSSLSDPMLEFKELVKEAHKRNIKVYMDLVFNHTSHDFVLQRLHPEWFLYKEDIKSLDAPYLYPEDIEKGKPWGDAKNTMCPFDHGYWWEDAAQLNWEHMIPPASNSPPKNPTLKEMQEYFMSIPKYWIKHVGIDGFRCDVAYRVPVDFWKRCIHEARELAHKEKTNLTGDVVFIAETYVDKLKELFEAGFTAVYGDFSNKLYNPLTLKGYVDYMNNLSGNFFPDGSVFLIFPECHDFYRNSQKLLGQLRENAELSERANKSRWVLSATLPGIPLIFNGFEKLEWHPVNLFSYSDIDWESDKDLRDYIRTVNIIRENNEALQVGEYEYVETSQGIDERAQLFCFFRKKGKELMLVCVNMDIHNAAGPVSLHLKDAAGINFDKDYVIKDLLNKKEYKRKGKDLVVILGPGESHIFKVEQRVGQQRKSRQ